MTAKRAIQVILAMCYLSKQTCSSFSHHHAKTTPLFQSFLFSSRIYSKSPFSTCKQISIANEPDFPRYASSSSLASTSSDSMHASTLGKSNPVRSKAMISSEVQPRLIPQKEKQNTNRHSDQQRAGGHNNKHKNSTNARNNKPSVRHRCSKIQNNKRHIRFLYSNARWVDRGESVCLDRFLFHVFMWTFYSSIRNDHFVLWNTRSIPAWRSYLTYRFNGRFLVCWNRIVKHS